MDTLQVLKEALHELETSHGLYARDGNGEGTFELDFSATIEKLKEAIASMESDNDG